MTRPVATSVLLACFACGPSYTDEFEEEASVSCESAVDDVADPGPGFVTVANNVALGGLWDAGDPLQVAPSEQDDPGAAMFAKSGLLVRAGESAMLRLDGPPDAGNTIRWGGAPRTWELTIPACPGEGWLVYTGGHYVDDARSVWIDVISGGLEEEVCVGVGVVCPVE